MKFKIVCRILICCIPFLTYALDDLEITFFNVGQGNCTLVRCPKGPALLVDAGSTECPGNTSTAKKQFKRLKLDKIKTRLNAYLPTIKTKDDDIDLNVIVSHGDTDHYSWVEGIVSPCIEQGKKVRFLLGGSPQKEYGGSFIKFVKFNQSAKYSKIWIEEYAPTEIFPLNCGEVECKILSAMTDGTDKNYKSIVLKLSYGFQSVILTGDATGKTTDAILNNKDLKEHCSASILQASHHGADTDEANNEEFLKTVNPKYFILSSGERSDYSHPKRKIVERALNCCKLSSLEKPHNIQFHAERPLYDYHRLSPLEPKFKTYGLYESGYSLGITTYGIYHTLMQGDITFSWGAQQEPTKISLEKHSSEPIKELALKTIPQRTPNKKLIAVNLEALELEDEDIKSLFSSLPSSVISISLRDNHLELNSHNFLELFKNLNVRELDLSGNHVFSPHDKILLENWSNRGFNIPTLVESFSNKLEKLMKQVEGTLHSNINELNEFWGEVKESGLLTPAIATNTEMKLQNLEKQGEENPITDDEYYEKLKEILEKSLLLLKLHYHRSSRNWHPA
ncbi:MAG: MBL fold metallo-hydrolase [Candidatus Paracaedibacteraceae bacterium]|nr:MBL fold metallo-hydrolase [Candidatus Paracaedibacteraceae bacterium]